MKELFLIGNPVSHSLSVEYFNNRFQKEGVEAEYRTCSLPSLEGFEAWVGEKPNLVGLNVTSPYKQGILSYVDLLSDEAQRVGAVNCIAIERVGGAPKLIGFNTDVEGFGRSVDPWIARNAPQRALILGYGGAARAVERALQKRNIAVGVVSRSPRNSEQIAYEELTRKIVESASLIIQATPLGMGSLSHLSPPFPYEYIDHRHLCIDLIYRPSKTIFLTQAQSRGAAIQNGLDMLYQQAEENWVIWKQYGL